MGRDSIALLGTLDSNLIVRPGALVTFQGCDQTTQPEKLM